MFKYILMLKCIYHDVQCINLNIIFQVKTPVVNKQSKVLVPGFKGHKAPIKLTPNEPAEEEKRGRYHGGKTQDFPMEFIKFV